MTDSGEQGCPFCAFVSSESPILRNTLAAALLDRFPVSEGHTLVVPVRHEPDFSALSPEEEKAVWSLAREVIERLKSDRAPNGFNIGANIGEAAGQTVGHAHLHVIPRYTGDVADPRGGIRHVIPAKAAYWLEVKRSD